MILHCHICGDEIPTEELCYRIDGRVYCPRCVAEAACFAEEEPDADYREGFTANWEVIGVQQRGGFTERIVRERAGVTRRNRAGNARKGAE